MPYWYRLYPALVLYHIKKSKVNFHLWQRMSGCEWDDETDEVTGYFQYAFDGEDFISLDLSTETWVAAKSQAFATKLRWEKNGETERKKYYIHHMYAKWLKNIVRYGEDTLKRTVLPEVSLLQKSPSSPVTCHATGFYPNRAKLFWTKDGEELDDFSEILPNGDGTFQSFVDLDLSSVPAKDWDKFSYSYSGILLAISFGVDDGEELRPAVCVT
uniref:Ig-like domain-containing protein n=1 Tax=Neogobius melanostomus TaxID=47308 RepID=A0A8C6U4I8_9GOBI